MTRATAVVVTEGGAPFTLREVDGLDSKEICAMLNISENNLWVMLHRARMALREDLELNFFKGRGSMRL